MSKVIALIVVVSLLLAACTSGSSTPDGDGPRQREDAALDVRHGGVRVSAAAGAVPKSSKLEIRRESTPSPMSGVEDFGMSTLGKAVKITIDGGAVQPRSPLTVAMSVGSQQLGPEERVGVMLQSEDGEPGFILGRYEHSTSLIDDQEKATSLVIVEVPHLSLVWPVKIDVGKITGAAMTYVLQSTGLSTSRPACADDGPTVAGQHYSVAQPGQAWICLTATGSALGVSVTGSSPVPFTITSQPPASSTSVVTDLGAEGTVGAAVVRALGFADRDDGLVGPSIQTQFSYDEPAQAQLSFNSAPTLLLVQLLISTLIAVGELSGVGTPQIVEALQGAKCFHDVVQAAQGASLTVTSASQVTVVFLGCADTILRLSPAGKVALIVITAIPQAFAGSFIGLIEQFTGEARFTVDIEASSVTPDIPYGFLGDWGVHGGSLIVRDDATARSTGHGVCVAELVSSTWCNDVIDYAVTPEGDQIRLTVLDTYLEDENGARAAAEDPRATVGSYYLMRLLPDDAAITELHEDGEVLTEANGLGNPYLCRAYGRADNDGTCGQ